MRHTIRLIISLFVLLGIVAAVWWYGQSELNWLTLIVGILWAQPFVVLANLLQALRHKILIGVPGKGFSPFFTSIVLAVGLNLVLPARLSELIKVTYLRQVADIPASIAVSALVLERVADIAFVTLLAATLPFALVTGFNWQIPIVVGLGTVAICVLYRPVLRLLSHIPIRAVHTFIRDALSAFRYRVLSRRFLLAIVIGVVSLIADWASTHVFLYASTESGVFVSVSFAVFLAGVLGGGLALLPGAVGSYHAAVSVALVGFGFSVEQALGLSVGLHLVQYALMTPAALVVASLRPLGLKGAVRDARTALRQEWGRT